MTDNKNSCDKRLEDRKAFDASRIFRRLRLTISCAVALTLSVSCTPTQSSEIDAPAAKAKTTSEQKYVILNAAVQEAWHESEGVVGLWTVLNETCLYNYRNGNLTCEPGFHLASLRHTPPAHLFSAMAAPLPFWHDGKLKKALIAENSGIWYESESGWMNLPILSELLSSRFILVELNIDSGVARILVAEMPESTEYETDMQVYHLFRVSDKGDLIKLSTKMSSGGLIQKTLAQLPRSRRIVQLLRGNSETSYDTIGLVDERLRVLDSVEIGVSTDIVSTILRGEQSGSVFLGSYDELRWNGDSLSIHSWQRPEKIFLYILPLGEGKFMCIDTSARLTVEALEPSK